jgi:hypothetical protein
MLTQPQLEELQPALIRLADEMRSDAKDSLSLGIGKYHHDRLMYYEDKIRALAREALAGREDGFVRVPRQPTTAMLDAAGEVMTYRDDFRSPFYMTWGQAAEAWEAMILAASPSP